MLVLSEDSFQKNGFHFKAALQCEISPYRQPPACMACVFHMMHSADRTMAPYAHVACIWSHSWSCVFYGFEQIYNGVYLPWHNE